MLFNCASVRNARPGSHQICISNTKRGCYLLTLTQNPSLEDDCSGLTSGKPYCIEENFGNGPVATSKSTAITKLASILEKEKVMLIARSPASPQFSPTQPGIISTCMYSKLFQP